ncbi:MAG: phage tail assembly chaperone [Bacteroidota bacterium]
MKQFIVYNSDGDILRTGSCPDNMIGLQAGDGEFVIDGVADDVTKRIIDGAIVDKPIQVTYISIDEIRFQRDILIAKTDWTQLPDAPLTKAQKAQYKSYRTALRDLPQKYVNMQNIINVDYPQLEDF